MLCPIHPFSEDLNEGMGVADDAPTGVLFHVRIDNGKKESRYLSVLEWGIWSLV